MVLMAASCAKDVIPAVEYPPRTTLELARSARCQGETCRCRPLESDEGQSEESLPAGHKRFELRLPRTTSAIWVSVADKGIYYKSPDQVAPSCFYVDLRPGMHGIALHSQSSETQPRLQTALTINEYGPQDGPHWYRSLHFVCGSEANSCTTAEAETWARFQRGLPRGVLDPCGSVMVRNVKFSGTRPDRALDIYSDLTVRFTLKVYDFETYRSPNSPECKAPIKNR